MMQNRLPLVLAVTSISLLLLPSIAFAGLGVSPASVDFKDMMRGGYAERYFTVSNIGDESVIVRLGADGEISGWISADPNNFTMEPFTYVIVKVMAEPPEDTPNGFYTGKIFVTADPVVGGDTGGAGLSVTSGVAVGVNIEVSDIQNQEYKVEGVNVLDTEECRDMQVFVNTRNTGNVKATPVYHMEVVSSDASTVLKQLDAEGETLLPTQISTDSFRIPYDFEQFGCVPTGEYVLSFQAFLDGASIDERSMRFNIYPRGTLTVAGELQEVIAPAEAKVGDLVKIEAVFNNIGQIPARSKVVAEVFRNGKLVDTIEGDEIEVGIRSIEKIPAFFRPGSAGNYKLSTHVSFEGKTTDSRNVFIRVTYSTMFIMGAGIAGAAIIIIALVLIMKKGKKGRSKGKRKRGK